MTKNIKNQFQNSLTRKERSKKSWIIPALLVALIALLLLCYRIPAVQTRVDYYWTKTRARVFYWFKPPAKEAFVPQQQGTMVATLPPTLTPSPSPSPTPEATASPTISPTPTLTPTPLPPSVMLKGIEPEKQGFNNCGPTNLAMALSYWGWKGDQRVTEKVLKPRKEDRNVMPYEMLAYVKEHTELSGVVRYGGNLQLVKQLISAGFPVVFERGYMDRGEGWMGHYGIVTAYDDVKQEITIPDSYLGTMTMSYDDFAMYWAQFDDIYLLIYPPEREAEIQLILGPQWDEDYNKRFALDQVTARLYQQKGRELFFAWYSRGSILVELQDYYGASQAYDEAFKVYEALPPEERPWRVFWYQTGPLFAYYYMGRYQDVYNLAEKVLDITPEDAIPETWVWKGRAAVMLGKRDEAIYNFKQALYWHPNWWVAENELRSLGIEPEPYASPTP